LNADNDIVLQFVCYIATVISEKLTQNKRSFFNFSGWGRGAKFKKDEQIIKSVIIPGRRKRQKPPERTTFQNISG
jgi:hypothetical protein